jgi:FtsP/CotA-like multicopper oxidase with cupredoxin domain
MMHKVAHRVCQWFFHIVLTGTAVAALTTAHAAPVELPVARIVSASSPSFSVSLRATNRARAMLRVGTDEAAENRTLLLDGLYLYGVNETAPSLFPPVIVARQGQALNVRLINDLQAVPASASQEHPEVPYTNLHSHGVIVPTAAADNPCGIHGDNIFVDSNGPSAGAACQPMRMQSHDDMPMHGPAVLGQLQYHYPLPRDHPTGLFWLHPHRHGSSQIQVGGGMSTLFYVDPLQGQTRSRRRFDVKWLMLKDLHLLPTDPRTGVATRNIKYDSDFCGRLTPLSEEQWRLRRGICFPKDVDDAAPSTGTWVFPVSGVVYPTITVRTGKPQIWRITNASADASYRLQLVVTSGPARAPKPLRMRVLALDGGTLDRDAAQRSGFDELVLMPSARAEVLVDPCDLGVGTMARGQCVLPKSDVTAELRTLGLDTGNQEQDAGDPWPAIALARVVFKGDPLQRARSTPSIDALMLRPETVDALQSFERTPTAAVQSARTEMLLDAATADHATQVHTTHSTVSCTPVPLPDGHVRVIRFGDGLKKTYWTHFGLLATSSRLEMSDNSVKLPDLDKDATPKPGDYPSFGTPKSPSDLCIRYGSVERWVLVNDTDECHNFHIHQTHFRVREIALNQGEKANTCLGDRKASKVLNTLHDNFPMPPGSRIVVDIPFTRPEQIGKFVYHCHILGHEDKGMMATIEVVR